MTPATGCAVELVRYTVVLAASPVPDGQKADEEEASAGGTRIPSAEPGAGAATGTAMAAETMPIPTTTISTEMTAVARPRTGRGLVRRGVAGGVETPSGPLTSPSRRQGRPRRREPSWPNRRRAPRGHPGAGDDRY